MYPRRMTFRMRSEPLCRGRWTCSISLSSRQRRATKIFAEADRMRRGKAHPGNALDGADGIEQLHERADVPSRFSNSWRP